MYRLTDFNVMSSDVRRLPADIEFASTGVPGLEEMLEGKGIPKGYKVVVMGTPGAGKTTLAIQFLVHGCKIGENGIYVSLDEKPFNIFRNMRRVGLDVEPHINERRLSIVDASPIRTLPGEVKVGALSIGKRDFSMAALITSIKSHVEDIGAERLVIDPLTSFLLQFPDEHARRTALMDLLEGIAPLGCTTLLLTELRASSPRRRYQFEEYLAEGVIIMMRYQSSGGIVQSIRVEKMRGVNHDVEPHPYKFTPEGIVVFPSEKVL
ncbi:Circadian clock protein kinase KaiC [archaeon HR01]|nr:Circadian clock protein kinase KaiC [archaeon HR01]